MFKTREAPKTWADRAAEVPAERASWIVALGGVGVKSDRDTEQIDAAVAEVEACGWRLDQLVPAVNGTHMGQSGNTGTMMVGHFRRAGG